MMEDFYNQTLYRIHDPKQQPGCFDITGSEIAATTDDPQVLRLMEAQKYNADNWGIYWTVNKFSGPRKKENLEKLRAWYVECDGNNKHSMMEKLQSRLRPSMIIESKAGYHAYWFCDASATTENYSDIIEFCLIPFYDGDRKAKDVARILRVPDFFHCKDPQDKFLVRLVYCDEKLIYSEPDIRGCYPVTRAAEELVESKKKYKTEFAQHDNLWDQVFALDCEEALMRISGTDAVCGETYSFRKTTGGSLNLFVNGKATSCWIDRNKRIGSTDRGGPTIFQWINWYHKDSKKSFQYLKQYFPELFDAE